MRKLVYFELTSQTGKVYSFGMFDGRPQTQQLEACALSGQPRSFRLGELNIFAKVSCISEDIYRLRLNNAQLSYDTTKPTT